jgi:hypothetical protein
MRCKVAANETNNKNEIEQAKKNDKKFFLSNKNIKIFTNHSFSLHGII